LFIWINQRWLLRKVRRQGEEFLTICICIQLWIEFCLLCLNLHFIFGSVFGFGNGHPRIVYLNLIKYSLIIQYSVSITHLCQTGLLGLLNLLTGCHLFLTLPKDRHTAGYFLCWDLARHGEASVGWREVSCVLTGGELWTGQKGAGAGITITF